MGEQDMFEHLWCVLVGGMILFILLLVISVVAMTLFAKHHPEKFQWLGGQLFWRCKRCGESMKPVGTSNQRLGEWKKVWDTNIHDNTTNLRGYEQQVHSTQHFECPKCGYKEEREQTDGGAFQDA